MNAALESTYAWRVVPLSPGQRLDVRPSDVVADGHFRLCDTYRGGGGYDHFPTIAERVLGEPEHHLQFIPQLYGCNLDCPYCYVTRAGVWGAPVRYTAAELVAVFNATPATVFHLMGGAPALTLAHWSDLIDALDASGKPGWVFHSDLMLSEAEYDRAHVSRASHPRAIYAVNLKGLTAEEHLRNTRKPWDEARMWRNLATLEAAYLPYYVTFTAVDPAHVAWFWNEFSDRFGTARTVEQHATAYAIHLIDYDSLPHTDDVPWARRLPVVQPR